MNRPPIYKGEIYYCSLPYYSNSVLTKDRPCVIISNSKANETSNTVQVCPLTSTLKRTNLPCHVVLEGGGMIKCEQIYTIDKEQVKNYKCRLNEYDMRQVNIALLRQLEII